MSMERGRGKPVSSFCIFCSGRIVWSAKLPWDWTPALHGHLQSGGRARYGIDVVHQCEKIKGKVTMPKQVRAERDNSGNKSGDF